MSVEAFWRAGVAEVFAVIEAEEHRRVAAARIGSRLALTGAWHTEAFARTQRLPDLKAKFEQLDRDEARARASEAGPPDQRAIDEAVAERKREMERLGKREMRA